MRKLVYRVRLSIRAAKRVALLLFYMRLAHAADPPFSIFVVPDPQYIAQTGSCAGATMYNAMIQWAITNKNLVVGGVALNAKGFITVGDLQDVASWQNLNVGETIFANAFALAEAANMFVSRVPGNHDYEGLVGSPTYRSSIGHAWRSAANNADGIEGRWSPATVAALYPMSLGSGDTATFGGIYTDPTYIQSMANNYMKLNIGSRKILLANVEFHPRSPVMVWVKSLHDANPGYETWMATHSYQTVQNNLSLRGLGNRATNEFGPDAYPSGTGMGAAPLALDGDEMWNGASGWTGLKNLSRLSLVLNGHWINGYDGGANWVWQKLSTTNVAGTRVVHQIFTDAQNGDNPGTCTVGTSNVAHLFVLRILPTTMEAFMVSTNTGLWTGVVGSAQSSSATPISLFGGTVSFVPVSTGMFPMPSALSIDQ